MFYLPPFPPRPTSSTIAHLKLFCQLCDVHSLHVFIPGISEVFVAVWLRTPSEICQSKSSGFRRFEGTIFLQIVGKNYTVTRHYDLKYSYPLPANNRRLPNGWWLTSFVDACHGVYLCIGRQVYSEFSKFLPEITFPLPRMHVWKWILPMKNNFVLFSLRRQIQR